MKGEDGKAAIAACKERKADAGIYRVRRSASGLIPRAARPRARAG